MNRFGLTACALALGMSLGLAAPAAAATYTFDIEIDRLLDPVGNVTSIDPLQFQVSFTATPYTSNSFLYSDPNVSIEQYFGASSDPVAYSGSPLDAILHAIVGSSDLQQTSYGSRNELNFVSGYGFYGYQASHFAAYSNYVDPVEPGVNRYRAWGVVISRERNLAVEPLPMNPANAAVLFQRLGPLDVQFYANNYVFGNGGVVGEVAGLSYRGTATLSAFSNGVPEPGAWALMIGGFALAGASLRGRRSAVA